MRVYEVKETCLREVNTKQWLGLVNYSPRNTTYVHFVHENKDLIITYNSYLPTRYYFNNNLE